MEILLISEYFLLVALVIFLIASMRVISYKSVAMGLIGTSSLTLALTIAKILIKNPSFHVIKYSKKI